MTREGLLTLLLVIMAIIVIGGSVIINNYQQLKRGDLNLDGKVNLLDVSIMADNLDKM